MVNDVYVDFSGRFSHDLFIGTIISDYISVQKFWENDRVYSRLRRSSFNKFGKKERSNLVSALENSEFQINLGIFPKKEYTRYNSQIYTRKNWKSRLLTILLYLTIRDHIFTLKREKVKIEKGEYPTWLKVIKKRMNRMTNPLGTSVLIGVENKFHPGILLADHVAGIGRLMYLEKLKLGNKFRIIQPSTLEYYINKEFRL